ncbi:MAG: PilZ domain-containing protein [Syntrophobacteria bacterium]
MQNSYWENCPYYTSGKCPQPAAIDRAYLIPQLLAPSEVEAAKQICRACGKYLDDKRKYPRIARPLQVILLRDPGAPLEGDVVNISEGGVLVRLQSWADFDDDEKVVLEIYPQHLPSENTSPSALKLSAQVKRKDAQRKQLAIVFLGEIDG